MKRYLLIVSAALLMLSGCTYPYETELSSEYGGVVIEGEILIGDYSDFTMSRRFSLSSDEEEIIKSSYVPAEFSVEDSQGKIYKSEGISDSVYGYGLKASKIDLRNADPSLSYRLHAVNGETGKEYVSDWLEVEPGVVIDNMSYAPDSLAANMDFRISFHAPARNANFMVKLQETWEYRSMYRAQVYYKEGELYPYLNGENTYFCWNSNYLGKFVMLSSEELSDDAIVDHYLSSVPKQDRRLSYIYSLEATVIPLSKEAYIYWNYLKTLSEYSGSLFAPNPSDMKGNLYSVSDPEENVTGYISATHVSKSRVFFDNDQEAFYVEPHRDPEYNTFQVAKEEFKKYYWSGYRPVSGSSEMTGYWWAPARCVDCTFEGGTKNKPDYWPNDDK